FGNGKTAVKFTVGRYVTSIGAGGVGQSPANVNPTNAIVQSTTRTWSDANRNFIPDCDLHNFAANGECGTIDNSRFGTVVPNTTQAAHFGDAKQIYTGVDASVTGRFGSGGRVSGGMSTGRTMLECVSPDLPTLQFCKNVPPFWQPQFKLAAVYPLPWWGVQA